MMSYYGYPAYESVAEKKAKADRALARLQKKNKDLQPVRLAGSSIATTWWGKAWNKNLESYADYENRISRGKSYVRSHAVLDLKISQGRAEALILGSRAKPYSIEIEIDPLKKENGDRIIELCNHRIESLEQLAEGKFPKELEIIFTDKNYGMFPSPREIHFGCSCPDYAYMCKHVAAALYGVGARLDEDPMLFFALRGVDGEALIKKSVESKLEQMLKNAGRKTERVIGAKDARDLFGI